MEKKGSSQVGFFGLAGCWTATGRKRPDGKRCELVDRSLVLACLPLYKKKTGHLSPIRKGFEF
jgi:hypothetical protein